MRSFFRIFLLTFLVAAIPILFIAQTAEAAPFLICDPYPGGAGHVVPITFVLIFDGGTPVETPAFNNPDGSVKLNYDLSAIVAGTHTVTAAARDLWGGTSAPSSPFTFTKPATPPVVPTNINITAK